MVGLIVTKGRPKYVSGVMDRVKRSGYSVGDVSDETIDTADRAKPRSGVGYHLRRNDPITSTGRRC